MHILIFLLLSLLSLFACTDDGDDPNNNSNNNNNMEDGLPIISIDPIDVLEGDENSFIYLNIRLSKASEDTVSAVVSTISNTAIANEDFVAVESEPIVFEPGQVLLNFKIEILGDTEYEQDELFFLQTYIPVNADLGDHIAANITIQNDDLNTNIPIPTSGTTSPLSYDGMELIWQDEFDATSDLSQNWTFEIGNGNSGWGNNELQYYRAENASLVDGHLVIEAREESFGGRAYTSSRMITKNDFNFQYGRVDIRAALPKGQGIWPALWMLGNNISTVGWPQCGEIDIMEIVGHEPNLLHGTAHWSGGGSHQYNTGTIQLSSGSFNSSFHIFSVIWNETSIEWLLDDVPYHTMQITAAEFSEFQSEFFFIFNVAVGGNWPGSPDATTNFPQRMIVDYIRVFQ